MSIQTVTPHRNGFDTYYYEFGPYAAETARPAQRPVAQPESDGFSPARYWTGVGITALITALVGLIGLVLSRSILHLDLPLASGDPLSHVTIAYGLAVAGIAIVAGALYAAMIHIAPRPTTYFAAVLTAVMALAALIPFTAAAPLTAQLALAIVNVVVGLVIAIFIPLAASNA